MCCDTSRFSQRELHKVHTTVSKLGEYNKGESAVKSLNLTASIEAILAGDEFARQELIKQLDPTFLKWALKLLKDKGCGTPSQDVRGVVDTAWGKIFARFHQMWSPANLGSWSHTIIERVVSDHSRACRKRSENEIPFDLLTRKPSAESGETAILFDPACLEDYASTISGALWWDEAKLVAETIPGKFAVILVLRIEEDLGFRDIAERIGESCDNTRTIYIRGLAKLKKKLGFEEDDTE
jgi:DNA-directed RNA polymerase specialized sigma24 family protein